MDIEIETMKISDLIERLEELRNLCGDIDVVFHDKSTDECHPMVRRDVNLEEDHYRTDIVISSDKKSRSYKRIEAFVPVCYQN